MPEFDEFSEDYKERHNRNIAVSGEDTDYFARLKLALVKEYLESRSGMEPTVLDVGSGIGKIQEFIHDFLPGCTSAAVDISADSLRQAKKAAGENHLFSVYDGSRLPFPDNSFDVVMICTVLHHIPVEKRPAFMEESARVLKKGGTIFIFEHNPLNPLTRYVVDTCEFDEDAILLSSRASRQLLSGCGIKTAANRYYVFFPGFLKALRPLEKYMGALPLGGQYMVAGTK